MKKKLITYTIIFLLIFSTTTKVKAASTGGDAVECGSSSVIGIPCYDTKNNLFFANGMMIEITQKDKSTLITWKSGSQIVKDNVTVFGGAHNNDTEIEKTSIIMKSGSVKNIFGGGLHKSRVKESYVEVQGGNISGDILGGGDAALIYDDDTKTYYNGDPKNSPTYVGKAIVKVTGGTGITDPHASKVSAIYGGGAGISNTQSATVTIDGGSYGFAVAGGVNGYTGNSTLTINKGNLNIVQHGMRGANGESSIVINDGKITTVYVGTPENATVEKANLNIAGGEIGSLKLATVKNAKGESSLGEIKYNESSVKEVDENFEKGAIKATMKINFIVNGKRNELNIPIKDYSKEENISLLRNELKDALNLEEDEILSDFYTSNAKDKIFDLKTLKEGDIVYLQVDKQDSKVESPKKKNHLPLIILTIVAILIISYIVIKKKKLFN